eukprot:m.45287 g.45287  ORF g.45287 m.45287 type:complete len:62 (+) comp12169_c0_seq1:403-588(+)
MSHNVDFVIGIPSTVPCGCVDLPAPYFFFLIAEMCSCDESSNNNKRSFFICSTHQSESRHF